jgi:hypothetical protein
MAEGEEQKERTKRTDMLVVEALWGQHTCIAVEVTQGRHSEGVKALALIQHLKTM